MEILEPNSALVRSSLTLASEWDISDQVSWRNTVYVQSAFSDFSDTRFFFESASNVDITERLAFEFDLVFRRDSKPHGGLESLDVGTAFGIRWEWE